MEKRSLKKRLGFQVNAISVLFLVLSAVTILLATVLMFRAYNDNILVERAKVGMNVLRDTVEIKCSVVEDATWVLAEDEDFVGAVIAGDTSKVDNLWQQYYGSDSGLFSMVLDDHENVLYQSSTCPLGASDIGDVVRVNGVVKTQDGLITVYSTPVDTGTGRVCRVLVGFNMSTTSWLSKLNDNVQCDVTIFRDNIRLTTTIIDSSSNKPVIGTPMGDDIKSQVLDSKQNYASKATIIGKQYYVSYAPMYDANNTVCGAYFAGSDATDANNEFLKVILISVCIALIFTICAVVALALFVRKHVVVPIEQVSLIANEMECGQLAQTEVSYQFHDDEVGEFAEKLRRTRVTISNYIGDISNILVLMSSGDFTGKPNMDYIGDFGTIFKAFGEIHQRLSIVVSNMDASADGVKVGSVEIANGAQLLAEGTTKQAEAIEEINGTVANISSQVSETADNASKASSLSAGCLKRVEEQNQQMSDMLNAMNEIRDKSNSISAIIKTIEDIAFQTNILALNASVEAARAGNAGKGFAVVADEVRNLATKSQEAANNTNKLISDTVKAVAQGVELTQKTASSMNEVISQTKEVNGIVDEIRDAALAEAEAVAQVSKGIDSVTTVISQNSATAEETAASCEELASQSGILKEQVSKLHV